MKTNVTLKSSDRDLFGTVIRQNTKNGQTLSVSDLQNAYNYARFQYGWADRSISGIMRGNDFKERCYHLLKERGLIKMQICAFMEMVEKEGIVKVLKGLKVWKTTGRAENKSTYCDPYIWVLLAMEMNPLIYAKTVIWLTDSLIFNRVLAGTNFNPMNSAIKEIVEKPNYPNYSKAINLKVFGRHERGIRDFANAEQLRLVSDIENLITQNINLGIIRKESQIFYVVNNYKTNNLQNNLR